MTVMSSTAAADDDNDSSQQATPADNQASSSTPASEGEGGAASPSLEETYKRVMEAMVEGKAPSVGLATFTVSYCACSWSRWNG